MKLDWLTITKTGYMPPLAEVTQAHQALYIARQALAQVGVAAGELRSVKGNRFYAYNFQEAGSEAVVSVAKDLQRQGVMLTFSGKALALQASPVGLLERALKEGWKPTRVDVALDIMNAPITVAQIADIYLIAHPDDQQKNRSFISGKTGDTFYIGSRYSPKFTRIYDKGGEQGLALHQWMRIELEYKHAAAAHLAALVVTNINKAAFEMQTNLDVIVDGVTTVLMDYATSGDRIRSTAPKAASSKVIWVRDQVVPALLNLKEEDYEGFMAAMGDMLERVMGD